MDESLEHLQNFPADDSGAQVFVFVLKSEAILMIESVARL